MNAVQFESEIIQFCDRVSQEIFKKNADYAGDNPNPFAAFDEVAAVLGLTREQVWAVFYLKHVQAVTRWVKSGGRLDSESIQSRLVDLAAYPAILFASLDEETDVPQEDFGTTFHGAPGGYRGEL